MRSMFLIALLSLTACGGDDDSCNLLAFWDSFELILDDEDWSREDYQIVVSYEDHGPHRYACDVHVPFVSRGLDGGVSVVNTRDAGEFLPTNGVVPCTVLEEPADTHMRPQVSVGRALSMRFEGSPASVHLTVDGERGRILERDLQPQYAESTPNGAPECGIQKTGVVRVELP
jgi:hypothetical protein